MLDHVVVACIGPLTQSAAEDLGLHVDIVPAHHTIEGLVEALKEHFAAKA
jgi:uroporphyrinogen III methyltransferase/synthase